MYEICVVYLSTKNNEEKKNLTDNEQISREEQNILIYFTYIQYCTFYEEEKEIRWRGEEKRRIQEGRSEKHLRTSGKHMAGTGETPRCIHGAFRVDGNFFSGRWPTFWFSETDNCSRTRDLFVWSEAISMKHILTLYV